AAVGEAAPAAPLGVPDEIGAVDAAAVRLGARACRREHAPVRELGTGRVEVEGPDRALRRVGEIGRVAGAVPAEAVRDANAAKLRRRGPAVEAVERAEHGFAGAVRREFGFDHSAPPESALGVDAAVVEPRAGVVGFRAREPLALAARYVVARETRRE